MTNTINETNNLNAQVSEFLNSLLRVDLTLELADKYHVPGNKLSKITSLIFDLAQGVVAFSKLPQEAKTIFSFDDATALSFSRDLLGQNFLFLEDQFVGMMPVFESFGGKPEDYMDVISRISKALAEERKYFAKQLAPADDYVFKPKVADDSFNREDYLGIFNHGILEFLFKLTDEDVVEEFNRGILIFIADNHSASNDLFKSLLNNQEKIGDKQLIIENRNVDPTIANWLKDFIKEKGSNLFDELILAEYLAGSKNSKNLSTEDKNLLRKVLKLYRNLAFFPESQEDLPVEKWQILSFDGNIKSHSSSKSFSEKREDVLRKELEESLRTFQVGSLEHRAANEELERLNKNINQG
ncbi:MAG: hypothetical protein ACOYMB_03925 [Patescibacteria group bacterium]